MDALRLYGHYASISLRGQLEYRASFVMQAIGQFFVTGVEFVAIVILFDRFGEIRGWTLYEVAFLYGLISVTYAAADAVSRGFDIFGNTVKYGEFDRLLLRPRSTVLQLFGQELTLRRVGRFGQGVAVLLFAIHGLEIGWSAGRLVLLVFTVACGASLFVGIIILQATSAFWTTESLEMWNAFTYGGVSMSQYPIEVYRSWFRRFFTFVIPIACINYFPGVAMLNRPDPLGTPLWVQWLAPLAGPAFLFVSIQVWKFGVRHYQSTGS
jgi:viologen exporter family transport system permease protein